MHGFEHCSVSLRSNVAKISTKIVFRAMMRVCRVGAGALNIQAVSWASENI